MSSVGRASGIRASAMLMTGTQRTRMDAQLAYGSIEWKKEINAEGVLGMVSSRERSGRMVESY